MLSELRFVEYIRQFMHFTRIALNGSELFNFIRLKCGCKLASYDPKLLFVYRKITINWPISFQFHHSSFYFATSSPTPPSFLGMEQYNGCFGSPNTSWSWYTSLFITKIMHILMLHEGMLEHAELSVQCTETLWLKTGDWHPSLYGQWWTIHISAYVVIWQCILKLLSSFIHSDT